MLNLNSDQIGVLRNFSRKIDYFLGTLHQEQIVVLSYMISAISLLCFLGRILYKGAYQKKVLRQLKEKELIWKEKRNENHST
ncbi:hypothetical protein BAnh1_01140 [Bartonella australis AUST/NH1]|uniref:Heme exporter protein D n=1 Tax=Bartonella australis (strain Aust/NH1) TaxID=1094489 RepID=M1PBK4_BARAA|nr:hypothetical protein [Bartonella australis]AGF74006.1 hypothetical protein BAnh1_01140 [Bartonella australis AUST/NH1]